MVILQLTGDELSRLIQGAVHQAISSAPQQNILTTDELYTVQEAAEFLKISQATVYAKVQTRELPVSKRGGRLYFSKLELIDYVKSGRKLTAAEIAAKSTINVNPKN
ncbi:helix-turn-helix domain-containing protein [Pontibacter sp. HSC-14F20]|uniref:helix-turn-helix domain-containing protein n=1 Tax=Pontibacter sp. HSC-14F20 TaxID=2864136 RepID=UPI001C738484|nr:helix-turn-helix domain-containing protein [Pontibacter sp. HSC-14F20]MBX0332551.1 helix-turn-helix domain-containing protein [Pontibacter sp. HSC-14F20]